MKTLILPLVSTGNVPQLATDLILHSLSSEFEFVKTLDSSFLHPFVGPLDYSLHEGEPILYRKSHPTMKYSSALELFVNDKMDLYVIQQRTPIIQGYLNNFITDVIVPLINELKVTNVTIMDSYGSLDENVIARNIKPPSGVMIDSFFSLGICKVKSVNEMIEGFESVLNLQVDPDTALHYTNSLFHFTPTSCQNEISTEQQIFKFTYHLLNSSSVSTLEEIKYASLFVHEGDNSLDAKLLCDHLPELANQSSLKITEFKEPISWKGVYGFREIPSTFDEGIYI